MTIALEQNGSDNWWIMAGAILSTYRRNEPSRAMLNQVLTRVDVNPVGVGLLMNQWRTVVGHCVKSGGDSLCPEDGPGECHEAEEDICFRVNDDECPEGTTEHIIFDEFRDSRQCSRCEWMSVMSSVQFQSTSCY